MLKNAKKFVNYKRDLLSLEQVSEIESRQQDLKKAISLSDEAKCRESMRYLQVSCDKSLPNLKKQNVIEENIDTMFVALVVALGLRAYYLQPFRIPTGSMQPSLNGVIGKSLEKDKWPSLPQRMFEKVMRGRSYERVVNLRDRQIALNSAGEPLIQDFSYLFYFTKSAIQFTDGSRLELPNSANSMLNTGGFKAVSDALRYHRGVLRAGTVVVDGYTDTGDLVLVDKFSYHFRKPNRGEVFVFDTLGIKGIDERSGEQAKGSHYIKRLCGVPGDTLSIKPPYLYVNEKIASELGMQRVMKHEGVYSVNSGYELATPEKGLFRQYLAKPNDVVKLALNAEAGHREYFAMGDNTSNSLDSRYWGPVQEYNLLGPALFSLWPITTGHWGFIK